MIEIKAPNKLAKLKGSKTVFMAGSIDMGKAIDWQKQVKEAFADDKRVTFWNPRRDDWNCVDGETKAVTKTGIKHFSELKEGELILTLNIETNALEYQPILRVNIFDVDTANMLRFKRNDDVFLFTENHKVVSRKSTRGNISFDLYEAISLSKTKEGIIRIPTMFDLNVTEATKLIPEGNLYLDDHFRLAAWILAEGSIFKRKDCNATTVTIAQYISSNEKKVAEIQNLLSRLDIKYRYDERQFILQEDAVQFITGILDIEKYKLPHWVKDASSRQKQIFVQEYAKGDGSHKPDGTISYIAFSEKYKTFAEEIQILAIEAGLSSHMRNKTSGFGHPVLNLSIHDFDKKTLNMKYVDTESYTGSIWCPTTKNKTWVAYRNGIPFITGNSTWKQDINFAPFKEQVTWELNALEKADIIIYCFDPKGQAPITLLELGLHVKSGKPIIVCCPDGFWRKGNVDIVCEKYGLHQVNTIEDLVKELGKTL